MPIALTINQATDAAVDQTSPDKVQSNLDRDLLISNVASGAKRPLIYFNKPFGPGATVFSAKLRVFQKEAWAGSVQLSVQRLSAEWSTSRASYNAQPGVTGSTATLTQSGTLVDGMWEIDVTTIMQEVANGAPWYGFRIITNRTTDGSLHKSNDPNAALRPALVISFGRPPEQPVNLKPSGGRAVSLASPTVVFDYSDLAGGDPVVSVQLQASQTIDGAGNLNGTITDTNEVASSVPQVTWPTSLVNAATWYYRVRGKNSSGLWSPWSTVSSIVRFNKGAVTITAPTTGIKSGTPTVSWTFTGGTGIQRAYEVLVYRWDTKELMWTSGKVTSTATSVGVPLGAIKYDAFSIHIVVRIYDTTARESTPGDPAWSEASWDGNVTYDVTVSPATSLAFAADPILPIGHLTWSRSVAPDRWQIQRSEDAGVTWYYIADAPAASYLVSGTNYKFDDANAGSYKQYQWKVLAVVAGNQASGSPTVSGVVKKTAPILMYTDMSQPIQFLNPDRDRNTLDVQELHVPLAGPPVLVTQRLGLYAGHMSGLLVDENTLGVTAKTLYERWKGMRLNAGVPLLLYEGDESYVVVAYNMQSDLIIDTQGVYYLVEFDWVQVA
jgi:hypothetical protein